MNSNVPKIALEHGLDLGQLCTTGSILHINEEYEDLDYEEELENSESCVLKNIRSDYIGEPVKCFEEFSKHFKPLDDKGYVKKKILEEGGGVSLNKECTVSVAFTGYWENELEPFYFTKSNKPLVVNLSENGLLPGLQMAIESMLVGELAVFLLSYHVMYGKLGVPPRIKPESDCIFYVQLIKSIINPKDGEIDFKEPNMFDRVRKKATMLYSSGATLFKTKNYPAAIKLFNKSVNMLHKCRLADEAEENKQVKLLIKLYINLAISYNKTKQPLKACIACNELNRLNSLWNNPKVLFQNAKALRMIGQFDEAQRRLKRALKLNPSNEELLEEMALINRLKDSYSQTSLVASRMMDSMPHVITDEFKTEVDNLIKSFKENVNICKLTLPGNLNTAEMEYIKEACLRENLFCNKIQKDYLLDKHENDLESNEELFT
ncbi:inactive peptidyl-prolyl cis-trans isomerase shutdown-like [Maniola jurtina]|uniref:inactive peptidyl-prolyl cis-trans isomerase shutdown-like n=1 Tax=Maniola jurtina TaxID=191418 RepID=UPI001E68A4DA|nr:inactive peptidyl-prolyl cis-trans isomerase shutdown-like [Maniola jurtina]